MHVAKTLQKCGGQSGTIQGDLKREDGRKDNLDTEELEGWREGKIPIRPDREGRGGKQAVNYALKYSNGKAVETIYSFKRLKD